MQETRQPGAELERQQHPLVSKAWAKLVGRHLDTCTSADLEGQTMSLLIMRHLSEFSCGCLSLAVKSP